MRSVQKKVYEKPVSVVIVKLNKGLGFVVSVRYENNEYDKDYSDVTKEDAYRRVEYLYGVHRGYRKPKWATPTMMFYQDGGHSLPGW